MLIKFIMAIGLFMSALTCYSDLLYLWLDNDEFAAENLLESEDSTFKAYVNYDGEKSELNISVGKNSYGKYWSWNQEKNQYEMIVPDAVPGDFGHQSENYTSKGDYRVVYAIDTGVYSINAGDATEYIFSLELDASDGTMYSAEIAESMIWDKDDRWQWPYKDHMCSGVVLSQASVPEPNSILLTILGTSLLMLRRRRS